MPDAAPVLEALVGIGTLYQFFLDRQPVDALEIVATKLKQERESTGVKKRGKWARVKAFFKNQAPPSRKLAEELSDVYAAGICEAELPVVEHSHLIFRRRHHKRHAVYFPEAQHVFESDRSSVGWAILTVGAMGLPVAEWVSDLSSMPAFLGTSLAFLGYVVLSAWNSSVEKTLWTTYLDAIRKIRNPEKGKTSPPADAEPVEGNSGENKTTVCLILQHKRCRIIIWTRRRSPRRPPT